MWLAGEFFIVQFVAVALCMQKSTHQHFGLGVFALYHAHVIAAGCFVVYIGHGYKATGYGPKILCGKYNMLLKNVHKNS